MSSAKNHFRILLILLVIVLCNTQRRQRYRFRPFQFFGQRKAQRIGLPKVRCGADTLAVYYDCRVCACQRPNRLARCFRKTCDLRTKDSGQCPGAIMRLDDSKLCPRSSIPLPISTCQTDQDCPGENLCCFDFCKGFQCVEPVPLDPGIAKHPGRGYA